MSVDLVFNAQGVDPVFGGGGGDLWTDGAWNKVIITESRQRDNQDKTKGAHLGLNLKAIEGPDTGKEGYLAVNVWNTDPATRERAGQQMAAICFATGVFQYVNTSSLHNMPFWIEVKHRDYNNKKSNNFVGVRNLAGVEPGNAVGGGGQSGGPAAPPQMMAPPPAPGNFQPQPAFSPPAQFGAPPQYAPPPAAGPGQPYAPPAAPQQFAPPPGQPAPGQWSPQGAPAPAAAPTWQAGPPAGAPAAPSFGAPPAMAPAPGNWTPGGAPAAAPGPGWGAPPQR